MRKRKLVMGATFLTLLCGCGYLSNAPIWEGYGRVVGTVVLDSNPLEGVMVFAIGEPERMQVTGSDGSFDLIVDAGEDRHLVAMWGPSLGTTEIFDLAGEANQDLGNMELGPVGILEGEVDLASPQQAQVVVSGSPFVTRPREDGSYRLLLPAGTWDLEVGAEGYLTVRIEGVRTEAGKTGQVQSVSLSQDPDNNCVTVKELTDRFSQGGEGEVDILFMVDNSGSMVGEQMAMATSFEHFAEALEDAGIDYRIAVVTPGMESDGCPPCDEIITMSCMNETGENGRFQDRLGHNQGTEDVPDFVFEYNPSCRVVDNSNLDCLYDQGLDRGTVLVGINGCGYERGLAGIRTALGELSDSYNQGFLRPWARLAVIVVSDEDDCGEVGDVNERLPGIGGNVCYYAAKGVDPEGNTEDPEGDPYALTPVGEYASFLRDLKGSNALVSFSAIVGVVDPEDPSSTTIEYEWDGNRWDVTDACTTPGCTGSYCFAEPGTRYIDLAQRLNGVVETICQADFSTPMLSVVGASTGYSRIFKLSTNPVSEGSIAVFVNHAKITSGFRYEADIRTIVFDQDHTPPPYSLVEIRYDVACD